MIKFNIHSVKTRKTMDTGPKTTTINIIPKNTIYSILPVSYHLFFTSQIQ